jgi:DNA-binding transcriptional regulator GbsR (MarR family)
MYEDVAGRRGLPAILGRVMAVFFLEGRGLSQKEVSDLTGYSVSSVSRTLDQMVRMGLIHRHRDPSHRHFVYHMDIDYYDLAISGLEAWIGQAEATREQLKSLRQKVSVFELKGEDKAEANRFHALLKNMGEKLDSLLHVIAKDVEELKRSKM